MAFLFSLKLTMDLHLTQSCLRITAHTWVYNITLPAHPKANGLWENFNKLINKVVRTSIIEKNAGSKSCINFFATTKPHSTTGKTPAELLFQVIP